MHRVAFAAVLLAAAAAAATAAAPAPPPSKCASWFDSTTHGPLFRSARDYGAKGDGTTDDTAALQRALTEGRTANFTTRDQAVVYLPPGRYLVSDTLPLFFYTKLMGSWACRPTLVLAPNSPGFAAGRKYVVSATMNPQGEHVSNFYHQVIVRAGMGMCISEWGLPWLAEGQRRRGFGVWESQWKRKAGERRKAASSGRPGSGGGLSGCVRCALSVTCAGKSRHATERPVPLTHACPMSALARPSLLRNRSTTLTLRLATATSRPWRCTGLWRRARRCGT